MNQNNILLDTWSCLYLNESKKLQYRQTIKGNPLKNYIWVNWHLKIRQLYKFNLHEAKCFQHLILWIVYTSIFDSCIEIKRYKLSTINKIETSNTTFIVFRMYSQRHFLDILQPHPNYLYTLRTDKTKVIFWFTTHKHIKER